ncbi:hypothetical protein VTG60DRAFT_263 [Thermothelomyces hinnuleus]
MRGVSGIKKIASVATPYSTFCNPYITGYGVNKHGDLDVADNSHPMSRRKKKKKKSKKVKETIKGNGECRLGSPKLEFRQPNRFLIPENRELLSRIPH